MNQIQHVIVLMLENRSFDHVFGFLDHPDPSFKGLSGTETNKDSSTSKDVGVKPVATGQLPFDPHHGHKHVRQQLTRLNVPLDPSKVDMSGFVDDARRAGGNDGPRIMECFDPSALQVLPALAREFVIADQWFCSVPGPTWPNRNFAHAASSDNRIENRPYKLYGNTTIYERLESAKATWRIFHDGFPLAAVFWKLSVGNRTANFHHLEDLWAAIRANALPNYSFVEPRHYGSRSNSHHPMNNKKSNRDIAAGELLIWTIYNELTSNPQVWEKTLFVITYDEHGGFYDHEKPKAAVPPKKKDVAYGFRWNMTGVRVPTVFVSPWLRRGVADHTVYDHSSIVKSVRERFAPHKRALSARDAAANSWWTAPIWETSVRGAIPAIPRPVVLPDPGATLMSDPPTEDEEDIAGWAREVGRVLDAKADGQSVKQAAEHPPALAIAPPALPTRAAIESFADAIAEKVR